MPVVGALTYELSPTEKAIVDRAKGLMDGARREPLGADERQAMRAFLQRGETRLSTYQRVAGVFLNGAGLLVLLPTVARETISAVLSFAIAADDWQPKAVLIPWAMSLVLPLYAFYLLLRDLVEFYFAPRFLTNDPVRTTRFSLAGLTLPYDEGVEAKAQVVAAESSVEQYASFIWGDSQSARDTVEAAARASHGGRLAFPLRYELARSAGAGTRDTGLQTAETIGVTMSIAGSLDLALVDEVARLEISLARHALRLRRLVLRYSKALILFVWTTMLSLVVVAVASGQNGMSVDARAGWCLAIYLSWAASSAFMIRLPRRWIDNLAPASEAVKGQEILADPDLHRFERTVTVILVGSCVVIVALLVGVLVSM